MHRVINPPSCQDIECSSKEPVVANSDGHYIYYCGQESLRNGVAIIVNKRTQNAVLRCNLKNEKIVYDYDYAKAFDCVDHNYGKFLKRREYQTT